VSPTNAPALDDPQLREALKRCSPDTYFAACKFRQTGDTGQLPVIIAGVVERFVERELRPKLRTGDTSLRLREDLALDSLTMMEIVMLAEEILRISISNEELTQLRTLADVQQFFATKLRELARTAHRTENIVPSHAAAPVPSSLLDLSSPQA
jgi:3-hydroxyacyl-[acyl-carrier-protein] dehydratase